MPLPLLTSTHNPRIKLARALTKKKERDRTGLFLVEGEKLLREALDSGMRPHTVFAVEAWWCKNLLEEALDESFIVSESLMTAISTTDTAVEVVAIFPKPAQGISIGRPLSLGVATHQLQDPGNLGAIIRSADAAHADAVFVTEGSTDPWAPKCVRATMGSCFHLPIISTTLAQVREGYPTTSIYALALSGAESLYHQDLRGGAIFVIGNEGSGLPDEAIALTSKTLKIPIPGKAESLNAAMAATVCLFETVRQRL
ncbi:MAG: RNA methyltransferase [Candidatus Sericytochromatia bacterium]|nr:RNA methyltransferase [Candidatus Sericytochromatia bacterium]